MATTEREGHSTPAFGAIEVVTRRQVALFRFTFSNVFLLR